MGDKSQGQSLESNRASWWSLEEHVEIMFPPQAKGNQGWPHPRMLQTCADEQTLASGSPDLFLRL